jgi:hypothetical protein
VKTKTEKLPAELRQNGWFMATDKNGRFLLRNRRAHVRTGSSDKLETAIDAARLITQGTRAGIPVRIKTVKA